MSEQHAEGGHRVTPFELFFDLVFVFALTQLTTFLADDPTWHGFARALLLLGALWWSWAAYAWLTNTIDPDEDAVLAAMLVAMAAMFLAALAVPGAFTDHALLFGVAFLVVILMHLARSSASRPEGIPTSCPPSCAPAFAMREAIAHPGRDVSTVAAIALAGGSALYVSSYVAIRWRVTRVVRGGRIVATVAFVALVPVARVVPAVAALALVAAVWAGLHVYEIVWWREARAASRALRAPAQAPR